MDKYTVLLVEDHPDTRERLATAVSSHKQLQLIASVENCAAANKVLDKIPPDVMLTDLGLPDGNGLDLIRRVTAMEGDTEIMVIRCLAMKNMCYPPSKLVPVVIF